MPTTTHAMPTTRSAAAAMESAAAALVLLSAAPGAETAARCRNGPEKCLGGSYGLWKKGVQQAGGRR